MRKISLITERRADYSRFLPIIKEINKNNDLEYSLIVTGNHLMEKHGLTVEEIRKDDIKIDYTFEMFIDDEDSGAGMSRALGIAINKLPGILNDQKPDLILSGFDIAANLAITIVGAHMNIPVFHIQGGEVTGTIDESIRHAMSKFAHYHFAANDDACKRLIKLGEVPEHVFNVGCPSIDALLNVEDDDTVLERYALKAPFFIVLQHPVTTEFGESESQITETLKALNEFKNYDSLFILPNNDAGHDKIIDKVKASNQKYVDALGIADYVNLLKRSSGLIGNSSSGIHETPTFNIPTINIGSRQSGRLRSNNVFDSNYDQNEITEAIKSALIWQGSVAEKVYGKGDSAYQIVKYIKELDISNKIIQKKITY
ncbi:UDP-N-acetylglucosamine 2-epimerase [Akkermansiaceae bacterium]|nr:UDP-N-acetylglucosamine 2-epimerase [Akkermansiaceae bacterium]